MALYANERLTSFSKAKNEHSTHCVCIRMPVDDKLTLLNANWSIYVRPDRIERHSIDGTLKISSIDTEILNYPKKKFNIIHQNNQKTGCLIFQMHFADANSIIFGSRPRKNAHFQI